MNIIRHKQNVKNAADMMMNKFDDFPEEILSLMKVHYEKEEYQEILDLVAKNDVPKRESLASKITMFPNPDFKEDVDFEAIQIQTEKALDDFIERWSRGEIDLTAEIAHEKIEETPRFLFKAEGIDGTFNSASQAIIAWKNKNTPSSEPNKHSFKSIPKETGE